MPETIIKGTLMVKYTINAHEVDGIDMYDWTLSNGDEADELFNTAEDALADLKGRY